MRNDADGGSAAGVGVCCLQCVLSCVLGGFNPRQRTRIEAIVEGQKHWWAILILIFFFSVTFAPIKVDTFGPVLSRYQSLSSHDIWLMATGSLRSLALSMKHQFGK